MQLLKYCIVCVCMRAEPGFRRSTDLQEAPSLCGTLWQFLSDVQQSGKTSVNVLIHLRTETFKHKRRMTKLPGTSEKNTFSFWTSWWHLLHDAWEHRPHHLVWINYTVSTPTLLEWRILSRCVWTALDTGLASVAWGANTSDEHKHSHYQTGNWN